MSLDYAKLLRENLPERFRSDYLHGQMKPAQRRIRSWKHFAANEMQVLVSTTVVEVGVNVPNATVMMIENAERFGLAQLHQLRGRVGTRRCSSPTALWSTVRAQQTEEHRRLRS